MHVMFNLSNGTTTLWRHIKHCSKTPASGSTPGGSNRKFDIMVFREMIDGAIVHLSSLEGLEKRLSMRILVLSFGVEILPYQMS